MNLDSPFGLHKRKQTKTKMFKNKLSDFVRSSINVFMDSIDWFIVSYDSAK